ncbi:MAG: DUF1376 domain-containing protein [Mesorhizobium sp.]|uniref:DUF1376 domain-containing protein n=1 Tax=Mesorhizobium sp. TaxID=1871066 RepID=UPI00121AB881|nr:DUF1376 domain-containing protein [Mesorhizobium sp.]TIM10971.1 MAG: DUF1376 domain-containing protein [Mesorhizobium sp.]
MAKKRWFRFYIDRWLNGTFGLTPNESVALLTLLCALYDNEGSVKFDSHLSNLLARRCGMRPTSFMKALETLIGRGKVVLDQGYLTSKAVTEEIISREKLDEKSAESRKKLAEKRNEIREISGKIPSNKEDRIKKDNLRGSALHLASGLGEQERQFYLAHAIKGGKSGRSSAASLAALEARKAAKR